MRPILFHIGPIPIYGYGFMLALGFLISFYIALKKTKEFGLKEKDLNDLFPVIIISAALGARLFHAVFERPDFFIAHPLSFFRFWDGGLTFYGGLIVAVIAAWIFTRKRKINMLNLSDFIIILLPLGQTFGRFGCTLAGCCHGVPTNMPWGIAINNPHSITRPLGIPLHPTQLYQASLNFIVFLLIFRNGSKRAYKGKNLLLYGIYYPIARIFVEIFRGDAERGFVFGNVSTSQFISGILFVISISIFIYMELRIRRKKSNAKE